MDKKSIVFVFEAIEDVVVAYQFSIPVICLDACFIKCPNTTTVLMSATFKTTDGHLLTMCYGTASCENNQSWCFFLMNLRQVLKKYCPKIVWSKIVFMSDRNPSIIMAVKAHFPESYHLYCCVYISKAVKGMDSALIMIQKARTMLFRS